MKTIRIATRASKLAIAQTNYVSKLLLDLQLGIKTEIVEISTKGDRDKSDFLYKAGSIGFFTSELEKFLLDGRADLAVHSFKDLPTAITPGLSIAAVPKRESVEDVLITTKKIASFDDLPSGSVIGTSSLRRIAQLYMLRNDIKCSALRGNVETRIRKVKEGKIDAIVIARAGVNRLGLSDEISFIFPPEQFIPAPAQGALAVQIRSDDKELSLLAGKLNDAESRLTAEAERCVLEESHGGCSIPLGVYAHIHGDSITIDAILCDMEEEKHIRRSITTTKADAKDGAKQIVRQLLDEGGREILERIKNR